MPDAAFPTDGEIAAAFGLDDLRVGRHYLRDESRVRVGSIWMDTLWLIRVCPSFDNDGVIGVATAHGEELRGRTVDGWVKAMLSSTGTLIAQQIDDDPLPAFVSALPLLRPSNSLSLDGVGYELRFETIAIKGTMSFFNPVSTELVALERACLRLAQQVAQKSANQALLDFATTWERYAQRGA